MENMSSRRVEKYVSEHDPRYRAQREETAAVQPSIAFAQDAMAIYEQSPNDGEHSLKRDFYDLAKDLVLTSVRPSEAGQDATEFARVSLTAIFDEPSIRSSLNAETLEGAAFTNHVMLALYDGAVPGSVLRLAGQRHQEFVREQERELDRIQEETKTEFKIAVGRAVQEGWLPLHAEAALRRLDTVHVALYDRLEMVSRPVGAYNNGKGLIRVASEYIQPHLILSLKDMLFHEFVHEIAGLSITLDTREGGVTLTRNRKSGVSITHNAYGSNNWLNEAITERIKIRLSPYMTTDTMYGGSSVYVAERQELDRLIAAGLDERIVYAAYFENLTQDQSAGSRGAAFAELVHRVNGIDGPGAFSRLENRHIFREISAYLTRYGFRNSEEPVSSAMMSEDAQRHTVTVRVGGPNDTQVAHAFVYEASPYVSQGIEVSAAEQWLRARNALDMLGQFGGKAKYSEDV